jgi:hypothetical protein
LGGRLAARDAPYSFNLRHLLKAEPGIGRAEALSARDAGLSERHVIAEKCRSGLLGPFALIGEGAARRSPRFCVAKRPRRADRGRARLSRLEKARARPESRQDRMHCSKSLARITSSPE